MQAAAYKIREIPTALSKILQSEGRIIEDNQLPTRQELCTANLAKSIPLIHSNPHILLFPSFSSHARAMCEDIRPNTNLLHDYIAL